MALMQRSVAGLRANIELTNVVTANKVNAHMKDNKQLLNEVNVLRHEMRSAMLENSQLKSKIDFYESRAKSREARERNSEAMRHMEHEAGVVSMGSYDEPDRNQLHEYSGLYSHSHIQREASRDGQVENVSADMLPLTAPNISLYTNPSEPGLEFNSPNMPPIIIGADIDDDGSFQSTRAPSAEYDSDLKLDPTVSHISHASLDTNESVSEKVKNISVKISENSHANNNNKNVKSENLGSSIENKLDLIMSENSLEIKKQSAAHDILNKYTSKLESENSVRMAEVANTVAESHEKERSKKSKLKKNRDSAIKSVTLNSKVKFPSLVDLSTKTANHSHVPPGYSNALAIANAASKSGSYINESKLSSSDYSASNALNSTGYLDVLNNLNSKRNNSNSKSTKKTSQSTSSLGSRPLGWKRNEM